MPTYSYKCNCGTISIMRPISQRNDPIICDKNHTRERIEIERGAPLLYSASSPGTMAAQPTNSELMSR